MPALGINAAWGAQEWANFVLQHLAEQSALLRAGCRFIPTSGRIAHIPRTLTDGQAAWVAELAEIPSDAPTGDDLVLTPKKTANVVVLSNESIADAPVSELDAVGTALTRSVATAIDKKALSADAATATAPAGLLTASVPTQSGGVGDVDSFVSAIGAIESIGGVGPFVAFINPAARRTTVAPVGAEPLIRDAQQPGRAGTSPCSHSTPNTAMGSADTSAKRTPRPATHAHSPKR